VEAEQRLRAQLDADLQAATKRLEAAERARDAAIASLETAATKAAGSAPIRTRRTLTQPPLRRRSPAPRQGGICPRPPCKAFCGPASGRRDRMVVRARVLSGRMARLLSVPGWDPFADLAVPARPRRERAQSVAEASRLRREGLLLREIGAQMGVSAKTVHAWLSDPDGSKARERKSRYHDGVCRDCGGPCYRYWSDSRGGYTDADHPERCNIVVDLGRVRRVLLQIAADVDELARARTVEDLEHAKVDPDERAERRRRLAESPLAFPAHGRSIRQYRQALYEFGKSAGAAGRATRIRSTAASTRRRTHWRPRRGRQERCCSPKRPA
jgi:hypothetical protein